MNYYSDHHLARATARPLRVAYLVDLETCPSECFQEIFAESFGRWGGRSSLIVPAERDGIDKRYDKWLRYYDADIIYSFVDLSDSAVEAMHEKLSPAYLTKHQTYRADPTERGYYKIELPIDGLTSLSVLPAFISRTWGFSGKPQNIKILDKTYNCQNSFIAENFGFFSSSFPNQYSSTQHPEIFSLFKLTTEKELNDPHRLKDDRTEFVTDESSILKALSSKIGLLTPVNLSNFFSPYFEPASTRQANSIKIVVGSTAADKLLYWNCFHNCDSISFGELACLRVPTEKFEDLEFLKSIAALIRQRGKRDSSANQHIVDICSCSIEEKQLIEYAQKLRDVDGWLVVRSRPTNDHTVCIPEFGRDESVGFRYGNIFTELTQLNKSDTVEFSGNRLGVPEVKPWHLSETLPPAGFRKGHWIADVTIDRFVNHSQYINRNDIWLFPRRLGIHNSIDIEQEREWNERWEKFIRPLRNGLLSLSQKIGQKSAAITMPDDIDAIRASICNSREWRAFDYKREDAPTGRKRFAYCEPSDKGRYLLGVLQLFDSIPAAFEVLMNKYWKDIFLELGAVTPEKNDKLISDMTKVIRRKLGQPAGDILIKGSDRLETVARELLRSGRKLQREMRFIKYEQLKSKWLGLVEEYLQETPKPAGDDDEPYIRNVNRFDRSIQYLCQNELLFQGRDWKCTNCFNDNWVTIDDLTKTIKCVVCGDEKPAPVSGDWHFKGNSFVIEAYRDHGVEPVIWALWHLSEISNSSFYFSPSLNLWNNYPTDRNDTEDFEIDAVAIVDGAVYLIEAKSSPRLDSRDINKLAKIANIVRPDTILVACMESTNNTLNNAIKKLNEETADETRIELLDSSRAKLRSDPFLPD